VSGFFCNRQTATKVSRPREPDPGSRNLTTQEFSNGIEQQMEHCTSRDDFRLVAEAVEETTIHWNRKAHSLLARTTLYSLPQMHGVGKFREVSDLIASDSERNLEHFQIPYRCLFSNLNSSRVCRVTTRTEHDDVLFMTVTGECWQGALDKARTIRCSIRHWMSVDLADR
jgi:hypothetical protein